MSKYLVGAAIALFGGMAAASVAAAPHTEHWIATSRTAIAITGDIDLSPTRLSAAGKQLPLAIAADLPAFGGLFGPVAARVLRVTRPSDPLLRNRNRLCGKPVRWIVVYRSDAGASLNLAAYAGSAMPVREDDNGLCGTFLYSRP
ncbi:hypothetical protein [Sphingomonas sp.]|jgi:hypothetical protein|uniref:hypothetical protein n=1 Tax=Sphingomonas sp. TaxID=28214 RepID=UPI0035C7F671